MTPVDADAHGVAALALIAGLARTLIERGVLDKDEVVHLYSTVAQAKLAKGHLDNIPVETEAGKAIARLAAEVEAAEIERRF
jgi:hypothetical protein